MEEPDREIPPDLARQMIQLKRFVMGFSLLLIAMAVILIVLVLARIL